MYGNALQAAQQPPTVGPNLAVNGPAVGTPPGPAGPGGLGAPPAAQPHITPAPYDVAHDHGWQKAHPAIGMDHELRNFLNQLQPEERQMLLQRFMSAIKNAAGGAAKAVPNLLTSRMNPLITGAASAIGPAFGQATSALPPPPPQ